MCDGLVGVVGRLGWGCWWLGVGLGRWVVGVVRLCGGGEECDDVEGGGEWVW